MIMPAQRTWASPITRGGRVIAGSTATNAVSGSVRCGTFLRLWMACRTSLPVAWDLLTLVSSQVTRLI